MVHMIVYWLCHCFVSYFVELEAIQSNQKGFLTFASSYREKRISLPAKYYPLELEGTIQILVPNQATCHICGASVARFVLPPSSFPQMILSHGLTRLGHAITSLCQTQPPQFLEMISGTGRFTFLYTGRFDLV